MAYLASESIKALNPIEVTTDGKGEVIKVGLTEHTIKNFHAIKERLFDFFFRINMLKSTLMNLNLLS
ncbi:hypothetical protein ACFOEQ_23800 [Chryseobacterium arachidis]|uniref:hypothetical protein n=1 Tax=Chryseobacterium arachidis TaxID=1416778 RepID=UPI003620C3FB